MSLLQEILAKNTADLKGNVRLPEGDYIFAISKDVKMEEKLNKKKVPMVQFDFDFVVAEVLNIRDAKFDTSLAGDLIGKTKKFTIYVTADYEAGLTEFKDRVFGADVAVPVQDMINLIKTGSIKVKATTKLRIQDKVDSNGTKVLDENGVQLKTEFIEIASETISKV